MTQAKQKADELRVLAEQELSEVHQWLTDNCGRGLPYVNATDLATALHGTAYVLGQIERTTKYMVNIGQSGPASSGLRYLLEYVARNEIAKARAAILETEQ